MRGTTTQGQRPPRQRHVDNTTPHSTTQPPTTQQRRATHDMTRHHTTKKHTQTHTHTHMYMHLYVYMYMSVFMCMPASLVLAHFSRQKEIWNTYLPKKKRFHPGQKLRPFNCLEKKTLSAQKLYLHTLINTPPPPPSPNKKNDCINFRWKGIRQTSSLFRPGPKSAV